jgi:chromosome segregation ATPase
VKEDASTQGTLPEEAAAKPPLEAAKSRVAGFLTAFVRKKKTAPQKPPAATQPVPASEPVRAALFLDSKGKIVAAHARCAGFFGRQPDELNGLSIKDLLKPDFEKEIANILAKGKEANQQSFHFQALRKDGSEFATQFTFRFLQDFRFRWAVFVEAPAGSNGGADQPAREPKAIVPTTETATTQTPDPASAIEQGAEDNQAAGKKDVEDQNAARQRLRTEAELDKEREAIKVSRKKEEVFHTQVQTLQGALEQAEARAHEGAPQSKDWEKRAANLKKCVDELTRRHAAEQNAAIKAAQRVKELEEQLKRAGDSQAPGKKTGENQEDTRHRLKLENRNLAEANAKAKADLDKEREAIKASLKKEEELEIQVHKLKGAFEISEAHARESAAQSKEWENKAADFKKSVDELTRNHAAEQDAAVKATQRVKELEEQLKGEGKDPVAGKKPVEGQDDTRIFLKAENRNLTEANAKAMAELSKERDAIKTSLKKEEELQAQVQKLQDALKQAEVQARESATQSKDWEKEAADFKKSADEVTRSHAAEQNAAASAARRIKELEEQLERAEQAAGKKPVEGHDDTRLFLKTENRNLTEANAQAMADLDKEHEAIKASLKKEDELQTRVQKLQAAFEIAEARARESAAQSKDWEEKAADFKKSVDELTRSHVAEQSAAALRVKELEEQLKRAGDLAAGKKPAEGQDDTRVFLKAENRNLTEANAKAMADLDREREAIKASLKKEEELQNQVQKLQGAFEIAEAHARESAAQSRDWEKEAADFKRSIAELTRSHAVEQSAAEQRVKELEEQLKRAGEDQAAGKKSIIEHDATHQRLEVENRNLIEANAKAKADLDKEREAIKASLKKEEELKSQVQKLRGDFEIAEAHARESAAQSKDWENKAADLKKSVDELTRNHAAEQNSALKAAERVKELEEQLKRAGNDQAAGKKDFEAQDATRQRLEAENRNLNEAKAKAKADLDKEREAIKASLKKEEDLQAQVQKLQGALEQAEARSRESATQSQEWEKKAADFKKSVDELTRSHAAEQDGAAKAAQRVKELEEQLKRTGDNLAAGKKDIEDRDATRQRLEAENRNLTEASAKAKSDLDKERESNKGSRKKEEELQALVQKLQATLEQAEARSRESATQTKDLEKKAADLKSSVEDLARRHATEQNAAVKAAQRVKELEEQLKRGGDNQAAGKKDVVEGQAATRQRLEAENRNLTEASAKAKADLDKEREAIKVSRKKEEELQAQVKKLQGDFEKADARARESAAQSKDWEKKAADLKKSLDELTKGQTADQSAAAKRVKELEQQLKRAGDDLAASKTENRNLTESVAKQAALEKRAAELEEQARWSVFSLAKANAELKSRSQENERAEKSASSAAAQIKELEEKLKQQVELERAGQSKIAELEKTVQDRGDDLSRASAALRKEAEERQSAQKQSRLVSEMGKLLETKLASFEEAKKALEISLQEKDERLLMVERSLAEAKAGLEKESARRHRVECLLADARRQREKFSADILTEANQMYRDGLYTDCHELMKELMGTLDENLSVYNDALSLHTQTLTKLGRFGEAKTAAQQRIKSIEDRHGKKHPSLIPPLSNLAAILERTGFVFEAEQAMRRVSSIQKNA